MSTSVTQNIVIKQLEERSVANEIVFMVWSDRMDLIALANVKGEILLHRLAWTKAWNLNPPRDGLQVKGLAWRPDGKILAVAYSSGQVILVKVENKTILHTFETHDNITCINWVQEKIPPKSKTVPLPNEEDDEREPYVKYIDFSSKYLPDIPSQNFDSSANVPDESQKSNLLQEQNDLNLLLVGTAEGRLHINVFGCFSCAILDLTKTLGYSCHIEDVHLSENLGQMFVTVRDAENNIKIALIDSNIFQTHTKELFAVALKYVKLTCLVNYISGMITTITEAWESILLEMDHKLSKYATKVPEGGVTADFLDLLVFGICSDEMKEFLMHDLTKKGLEKFGQTIELSYSSIQKLLLKYVMKFGQNITYHLAELRGMTRFECRYKITGLSEDTITSAILSNGAFLIKGGEMQQIINHAIVNYKAFFRWLYTSIMNLMDEPIPNDIPRMSQQDLEYITEFLQNFDHIGKKNDSDDTGGYVMERLGQYLNDEPLKIKPEMSGNDWTQFLAQNHCLKNSPAILKHYEDMSLVQQYKHLKNAIEQIFVRPKEVISEQFAHKTTLNCMRFERATCPKMSRVNLPTEPVAGVDFESTLFGFVKPPDNLFLLKILTPLDHPAKNRTLKCPVKCGRFYFNNPTSDFQTQPISVMDLKFYSDMILSVLLQDNSPSRPTYLYQLYLSPCLERLTEIQSLDASSGHIFTDLDITCTNASKITPKLYKEVDNMIGSDFAVSGSRRVCIVLGENRRKVRLFEMEADEEEDEDADMTSASVSRDIIQDVSMQQDDECSSAIIE